MYKIMIGKRTRAYTHTLFSLCIHDPIQIETESGTRILFLNLNLITTSSMAKPRLHVKRVHHLIFFLVSW